MTTKKSAVGVDKKSESILDHKMILEHYDKLNRISNFNKYPWDLQSQQYDKLFVPTYRNIVLYYNPEKTEKMLLPVKPKKGGKTTSIGVSVYLF